MNCEISNNGPTSDRLTLRIWYLSIAQTVEIVSQGCMDLDGSYGDGQVAVGRLQRGTMRFFVNSQKLGFSPEYVQHALAAVRDILATLVP